jgi:hypothetical protein
MAKILIPLTLTLSPMRLFHNRGNARFVTLNLFQHLIESTSYETLKQVQGDKKRIVTQFLKGERRKVRDVWCYSVIVELELI